MYSIIKSIKVIISYRITGGKSGSVSVRAVSGNQTQNGTASLSANTTGSAEVTLTFNTALAIGSQITITFPSSSGQGPKTSFTNIQFMFYPN